MRRFVEGVDRGQTSFAPAFIFSCSQVDRAPLPAHVLPNLSRYLIATFPPFNKLPRLAF